MGSLGLLSHNTDLPKAVDTQAKKNEALCIMTQRLARQHGDVSRERYKWLL